MPGSGLSHSSYLVKNDAKSDEEPRQETLEDKEEPTGQISQSSNVAAAIPKEHDRPQEPRQRRTPAWVLLLGIVVIYLGALMLGLIPMNFLSQILDTQTAWTRCLGL